jgi:hypothetical protein
MCHYQDYTYACTHSAIKQAFCIKPCPNFANLARDGLQELRRCDPEDKNSCPEKRTFEFLVPFACPDCIDLPAFRNLMDPATAPIWKGGAVWHVPEGAAVTDHWRTTDPFEDDRRQGRAKAEVERRKAKQDRERSVSPIGWSGSGAIRPDQKAAQKTDRKTDWKNAGWNAVHQVKGLLRSPKNGLSETQITDLLLEHPGTFGRLTISPRPAEGPSLGTKVMKQHR